jgi:hypothetical protein
MYHILTSPDSLTALETAHNFQTAKQVATRLATEHGVRLYVHEVGSLFYTSFGPEVSPTPAPAGTDYLALFNTLSRSYYVEQMDKRPLAIGSKLEKDLRAEADRAAMAQVVARVLAGVKK